MKARVQGQGGNTHRGPARSIVATTTRDSQGGSPRFGSGVHEAKRREKLVRLTLLLRAQASSGGAGGRSGGEEQVRGGEARRAPWQKWTQR